MWKEAGKGYWIADKEQLLKALEGIPEEQLRRRMGYGRHLMDKALQGVRLNLFEKNHVEWGLTKDTEIPDVSGWKSP